MGVRLFVSGEIAYAADINEFFMEQAIAKFPNIAARTSAFGNGIPLSIGGGDGKPLLKEGQFCYLEDNSLASDGSGTPEVQFYNGTIWVGAENFSVADGEITNVKVNAAAAIALSKLAPGTSGQMIVANSSGVPAYVTTSGDVTVSNTGVLTIGSGVIVDADVNASAAIALSKLAPGTSGQIIVANSSGVPTYVTLSGDATINSSGVLTLAAELGTDTTGDYVATITASTGITSTAATSGEGTTHTLSIGQAVGTANNVTFAGVTADLIRVGVTAAGELDTSSGNLTIDSAGGTTTIDDNVTITGNLTVNGSSVTSQNTSLGYSTTVTSAGTLTLTSTSTYLQYFTGATTHTIVLPVTSTLQQGTSYEIHNNSAGAITINSSGGNLVSTVQPAQTVRTTCILITGTTAASWDADVTGGTSSTGTGALAFATSPTLTTPTLGVATATSVNGTTIPTSKTLVVTTDKLSVHASTTSSELAGVISDETGSGALVFANTPTLVTPNIGAATGTSLSVTGNVVYNIATASVANSASITSTSSGKFIEAGTLASAAGTYYVNNSGWLAGAQVTIMQMGTGSASIAFPAGTSLRGTPIPLSSSTTAVLRTEFSSVTLINRGTNDWFVIGDLKG